MCCRRRWGNINPNVNILKDSREPSVFRVQPHDACVFWSFPKEVQVFSAVHFQPWYVSLWPRASLTSESSHSDCSVTLLCHWLLLLTHRSLCTALHTQPVATARSQQTQNLFRAGWKQEIPNILHRDLFCRVLQSSVCLFSSVLYTLTK